MKYQLIFSSFLLFLVTACGSNENASVASEEMAEAITNEVQPVAKEKETRNDATTSSSEAEETEKIILGIRKEFSRIETLINNNQVVKKEITYSCPDDPQEGSFIFYFSGDTLLRATQSFVMGDHYGQESSYYFQNGQLIFGFHQSSVWNFAGQDDQGNTTTRDDINVQRDYFYEGEVVKQLFKDYAMLSGQKSKRESEVPNQTTGKGVDNILEGSKILNLSTQEVLTCEILNE